MIRLGFKSTSIKKSCSN